jgi:hypothetical protein
MPIPGNRDESLLNRAFGCFAFLGLATLPLGFGILLSVLEWMNFDEGTTGGSLAMSYGMVLAAPLSMGALGASTYRIWQTVRLRHPALVALSAVSVVCGGGLIFLMQYTPGWNGGTDSPALDYGMGIAFGLYITANLFIPAWWFIVGRRHYRSEASGPGHDALSAPPH